MNSPFGSRSRRRLRLPLAVGVVVAMLAVGCSVFGDAKSSSGDCVMFGGTPSRNMVNTAAKNLPTEWSTPEKGGKNIKWVAETGSRGYTSPVVAGGHVYVGTNNGKPRDPNATGEKAVLMCFNEADGKFLWQITHEMPPQEIIREAKQDGLCSTPAVEGDRIYYVTPGAVVVCANSSGKVIWKVDLVKEHGVFPCYLCNCSPLIVGDLICVVTGNGRDAENKIAAPSAPSFLALNKRTGELEWTALRPVGDIVEGQWGNAAYDAATKGVIFPGGDGRLYVDETIGKLQWFFDCTPKGAHASEAAKGAQNYLIATPVVHDSRVYIGVGQNPDNGPGPGRFWCLDAKQKGKVVWQYGGPAPKGSSRDYLFGRTLSSCAVHDGLVFVAELDGFLHCFDAATGQHYWEQDLKSSIWGSPYWADGKIYLGTDDGDVHVFAAGKEKKQLAKNEIEEGVKSTLVAANGTLYVLTDRHLFAIANK